MARWQRHGQWIEIYDVSTGTLAAAR